MDHAASIRLCPRCGAANQPGFATETACWCTVELPYGEPLDATMAACYCETCLEQLRNTRGGDTAT